jgi:hypothetical protein
MPLKIKSCSPSPSTLNRLKQLATNKLIVAFFIISFFSSSYVCAYDSIYEPAKIQTEEVDCARRLHVLKPNLSNYTDSQICQKMTIISQPLVKPCEDLTGTQLSQCLAPRLAKLNNCRHGNSTVQVFKSCMQKEFPTVAQRKW